MVGGLAWIWTAGVSATVFVLQGGHIRPCFVLLSSLAPCSVMLICSRRSGLIREYKTTRGEDIQVVVIVYDIIITII